MTDEGDEGPAIRIVPAGRVPWADVAAVVGPARCHGGPCWCQRFTVPERQWRSHDGADREEMLRAQVAGPDPAGGCGLLALAGDDPVAWCRVCPRAELLGLGSTAWRGRDEDRSDPEVFAVACLLVRPDHRRRGLTSLLIAAAVGHARARGAAALEAYPVQTVPGRTVTWGELHLGSIDRFVEAGFTVLGRPSKRRAVVRRELR